MESWLPIPVFCSRYKKILILNEQLAKMLTLPKTVGQMLLVSASQVLTHHFEEVQMHHDFWKWIW